VTELPRHLQLLWGLTRPGRPGPKPRLGLDDVARAGISVADRGGLAEVSMHRVAAALDLKVMSLYRYVESRDALLAVMVDVALGAPAAEGADGRNWRERLGGWIRALAERRYAHPWTVEWTPPTPALGPNAFAWMESGLAALDDLPLTDLQLVSILQLLDGWCRNHVRQAVLMGGVPGRPDQPDQPAAGHDYRDDIALVIDPARFPKLAAAGPAGLAIDEVTFFAEEFEAGLGIVLDGVAALAGRAGSRRSGLGRA
jgi:AcrR family transcriptional regulator